MICGYSCMDVDVFLASERVESGAHDQELRSHSGIVCADERRPPFIILIQCIVGYRLNVAG